MTLVNVKKKKKEVRREFLVRFLKHGETFESEIKVCVLNKKKKLKSVLWT